MRHRALVMCKPFIVLGKSMEKRGAGKTCGIKHAAFNANENDYNLRPRDLQSGYPPAANGA